MHEMSIAAGLVDILREEMRKCSASRLALVRVRHGALANVVPEALQLGFEALTHDTEMSGARLELVKEPLALKCGGCGQGFSPEASPLALFAPCPDCGEEIGHTVTAGKSLYLDHIEVE